eukprot:158155-Alexandrium_andersonii.AAC.1
MSASLVGSEMCIRDRCGAWLLRKRWDRTGGSSAAPARAADEELAEPSRTERRCRGGEADGAA